VVVFQTYFIAYKERDGVGLRDTSTVTENPKPGNSIDTVPLEHDQLESSQDGGAETTAPPHLP
jgi:hypothetical protein